MAALDPQLGHIAPTQALLAASRQNAVSFTPSQYKELQPTFQLQASMSSAQRA